MDNINDGIKKEKTIIQNCSTGLHEFDVRNTMVGEYNGAPELRMKCISCGVVVAQLMDTAPVPKRETGPGTMETIPVPERAPEPPASFQEPMEEARQRPIVDPPWADDIRARYREDKGLDNFWGEVWDKAKLKK